MRFKLDPISPIGVSIVSEPKVIKNNNGYVGTGVREVVAGTNVTVDNSNPERPIVSSTGGGGGGSGDVVGPSSSTDNAIARFDLATGKLIQDSLVLISDTGGITMPGTLTLNNSGAITGASDVHQLVIKGFSTQTNNLLRLVTSANSAVFTVDNSGQVRTGNVVALANLTYNNGSSFNYWSNSYQQRANFNSTASLDGATAGVINISGSLGSTKWVNGSSLDIYNTADQTTNTEALRFSWSSNVIQMFTRAAGTGVARNIQIGDTGGYLDFAPAASSGAPKFKYDRTSGTSGSLFEITASGGLTGSATLQYGLKIDPIINQSGTAPYTILWINAQQTGVGSGTKLLADFQTDGVTVLSIDRNGNLTGNTSNGTKIGTSTSQKFSFWNATPIAQPSGNLLTAVSNMGLVNTPTLAKADVGLSSVTDDAQIKSADFPSTSVDSEIALFSSTTGKVLKRATVTGLLKATSGVLSAAVAGTDYLGFTGTAKISVGTSTPSSPSTGDLWVDTN